MEEWIQTQLDRYTKKMRAEINRMPEAIPHFAKNGKYTQDMVADDITWWTNGFLGGILWQLYRESGDERFKQRAEKLESQLDDAFTVFNGLHHDVGFMWLHTAVADYRQTASPLAKKRALHAATLLAGRYNVRGEYLRSWNGDNATWVIIDSLMNIPLLYWASDVTGDDRFRQMAVKHADKVLANHLRADGSVNHIVIFDQEGKLQETPGGQGYAPGSSWSRGQSWAVYGFALSYLHTQDNKYLDAAKRVAHYFIANIQQTGFVPVVDFRSPEEPVKYDTSAGLCAACGLLEIAQHLPDYEKPLYVESAKKIIKATTEMAADFAETTDGIINFGASDYYNEESANVALIYADYFYLEALLRLKGTYQVMW